MAEDLNGYFSSVFTKEDISSLPVADAKFQGAKSDYLGPLVVTPELVAKKIKAMKDNKSPGVDGIPPKLLMDGRSANCVNARVFYTGYNFVGFCRIHCIYKKLLYQFDSHQKWGYHGQQLSRRVNK